MLAVRHFDVGNRNRRQRRDQHMAYREGAGGQTSLITQWARYPPHPDNLISIHL